MGSAGMTAANADDDGGATVGLVRNMQKNCLGGSLKCLLLLCFICIEKKI